MIWEFQSTLTRRLLVWSGLSIIVGTMLLIFGAPFWRGFGVQAVAWGAIDAAIAIFGQRSSRKRQESIGESPNPDVLAREARNLRRLLWINTGLDVLYMAGGLALALTRGQADPFLAGNGWGIVAQGAFLFLFDLIHARLVPMREPALPTLNLFTEPEHRPFALEGGRPAALLVHGFGGTPAEMRPLGEALRDDGWTAVGPLLPGFGAEIATLTERRAEEWLAAVEDGIARLRSAGHEPILLVGFSMGAALSLAVAPTARPDGLVLIAPFWWNEKPWQRAAGALLRWVLPPSFKPFTRANFDDPQFRQGVSKFLPGMNLDDPQVREGIREFRLPLALFDQVRHVSQRALSGLPAIRIPALIVQGAADPVVRQPQTQELVRRFPVPVQYAELQGGHDLTLRESPAWPVLRELVVEFARKLQDTRQG